MRNVSLSDRAIELSGYFQVVGERLHGVKKNNPETSGVVSAQESQLLLSVGTKEALKMSEIAKALQLTLSSVTALVDKLEAKAFVTRQRSLEDRRIVRVSLTAEGRKLYDLVEHAQRELSMSVLKMLSREEQDMLLALFRKVAAKLRAGEKRR
jgi:DNA-binding MarR family transcriptional regulator